MTNTPWLDPLNRVKIQQAVKAKQSTVKLRDGRKFFITYETEVVHLKPEFGLVPCGYFNIRKVSDPLWLSIND